MLGGVPVLGVGLKAPGAGGGDRGAARRCLQVAAVPRCAVLRPRRACALRSAPGAAPAMVSEAAAPLTVRFHGAGGGPNVPEPGRARVAGVSGSGTAAVGRSVGCSGPAEPSTRGGSRGVRQRCAGAPRPSLSMQTDEALRALLQRFYALQGERVETYRLFEE